MSHLRCWSDRPCWIALVAAQNAVFWKGPFGGKHTLCPWSTLTPETGVLIRIAVSAEEHSISALCGHSNSRGSRVGLFQGENLPKLICFQAVFLPLDCLCNGSKPLGRCAHLGRAHTNSLRTLQGQSIWNVWPGPMSSFHSLKNPTPQFQFSKQSSEFLTLDKCCT